MKTRERWGLARARDIDTILSNKSDPDVVLQHNSSVARSEQTLRMSFHSDDSGSGSSAEDVFCFNGHKMHRLFEKDSDKWLVSSTK